MDLFMKAGVGLGSVLPRTHVVHKELMEAHSDLHELVGLRLLQRRGRGGSGTQLLRRRNLRMRGAKVYKAKNDQRTLQVASRPAEREVLEH
jgi:hypothetical protein